MVAIIETIEKRKLYRVSRWIKIRQAYNVTKRNSLYEFATDENGYRTCESRFDTNSETFLDYFVFNGRKYALNQFIGGMIAGFNGYGYYDSEGKYNHIGYYDSCGNIYNSLLL